MSRKNRAIQGWLVAILLIIALFMSSSFAKYSGGTGESNDPYQIADVNDLMTLANNANDYNKCFIMTADIDLDPNLPNRIVFSRAVISYDTDPNNGMFDGVTFTGKFEGNDFRILNLTIDTHDMNNNYIGLFGKIDQGALVNILLEGAVITGGNSSECLGCLCGVSNKGKIVECSVTGSVSGGENSAYLGGLVGRNYGGSISKSHANTYVSGGNSSHYLGGLVGYNGDIYFSGDDISQCYASGNVKGKDYVGGLIGRNYGGDISNCYARGNISGNMSSMYLGGLIGYNGDNYTSGDNITCCYATGSVTAEEGAIHIGGLIGYDFYGYVTSCYFLDPCDGGGADNGIGKPLTNEQMHSQDSFVGFDFDRTLCDGPLEIWTMSDEGHPVAVFFLGYTPPVLMGNGTAQDPWQVSTPMELAAINRYPANGHFILTSDIDLDPNMVGCTFPTAVIAPDTIPYSGFQGTIFAGTLNGNGHSISNLSIDTKGTGSDYLGLFGYIGTDANINGVILNNVSIMGGADSDYLGALAGYCYKCSIIECYATGNVTGRDDSLYVGGLVGLSSSNIIRGSYAAINVFGGNNAASLGGLVGKENGSEITECGAEGAVTGGANSQGLGGLGGEVGFFFSSHITNCFATGSVTGGDNSAHLGGLIGQNGRYAEGTGHITNSYARGSIIAGDNSRYLGGLLGYNYAGRITACYTTSNIVFGEGSSLIGGLIGSGRDQYITGCYRLDPNDGGGPDNGFGEPLTDNQLKQQASFVGWDFVWETANGPNDVWAICEDVNYPKLAWEYVVGDSDNDKDVDFIDFAPFGNKWMQADSTLYCGGNDLTGDVFVDLEDLAAFAENWLREN
jgi:hypothetical protein